MNLKSSDDMISEDIFRKELDTLLRRRGLKKMERNDYIASFFGGNAFNFNEFLEMEEKFTIAYELSNKIKSEAQEQKELVSWFKKSYPGIDIMLVRNDGYRMPREKIDQIAMGLLPGASDLLIPDYMVWIEMKRSDGGEGQSNEQKEFEMKRKKAGQTYFLINGFDEGKKIIIDFFSKLGIINHG